MASAASSPTARRWELAARLRALRDEAGRTIEEVAKELMCSPAKISRMETGGRGIQPRDIRDLCRFYGLQDSVRDELMALNAEARKPGFWHDLRTIDEQTRTFVGLEAAATEILDAENRVVSGLLQTAEVTRAMLTGIRAPGELRPDWIEETVELRQRRQKRLLNGELTYHLLLDEGVLLRQIHYVDAASHTAQIDHLLDVSALQSVTVQAVPLAVGMHPGVDGSFQILQGPAIPRLAYLDTLIGNNILDQPAEVDRLQEIHRFIASELALSPDETKVWLQRQRGLSRRKTAAPRPDRH